MISVITPTARPEGLEIVKRALQKQTYKDFDWVIASPDETPVWVSHIYPVTVISDPEKNEGDVWTLNKAYNRLISLAKGDLIVSWQDYTYAKPDTLERFYEHYKAEPKTLVTAVGNKYADDEFIAETWRDPRLREDQGTYYPCFFNDIEFNLCGVPKQAFYDIGGFDEELDKWYGMDGYSVVDRLNLLGGYDFKIDQSIRSYSFEHGRPEKWEELNALHGPYNLRRKAYINNPRLAYLK